MCVLRAHETEVSAVKFVAPSLLLSGDSSGGVVLWKLTTRRPLVQRQAHARGLLAIHSIVWMKPHAASTEPESAYRDANGMLLQCADCRRTRRPDGSAWDVVPAFISASFVPNTSHGLCPTCAPRYTT